MATLLNLSRDVILCILDQVDPDEIVNFASTCRALHALARGQLQMLRKYANVVCIPKWNPLYTQYRSPMRPLKLFRDMIKNEKIRYYPRKLVLKKYSSNQRRPLEGERGRFGQIIEEVEDEIQKKLPYCKYWRPLIQRQFDAETSDNEKLNIIVAVLIIYLPNLRSIELWDPCKKDTTMKMLKSIATKSVKPTRKRKDQVLKKLINVDIKNYNSGPTDMCVYDTFTRLPSVRSIKTHFARLRPIRTVWDGSIVSGVETLEFSNSTISEGNLCDMIYRCRSLRKFKYEHRYARSFSRFDPQEIQSAFHESYAGETLTDFDLTAPGIYSAFPNNSRYRLYNFQYLPILTTIRINIEMFPVEFAGKRREKRREKARKSKYGPPYEYFMRDLLPDSIETLILTAEPHCSTRRAMHLILDGNIYHPRSLTRIDFETVRPLRSRDLQLCKNEGITVRAWDNWDSRTMVEL